MTLKDKNTRWCSCEKNNCLGPLTFHPKVKGQLVELSADGRRASRNPVSFRYGVTFSSRPVRVEEKLSVRVERCVPVWHGALRVGFTSIPPGSEPLRSLAIPDLTERHGFWALPIPQNRCSPRTELMFWATRTGYLRIQMQDGFVLEEKMSLIDMSKQIWAMIDVYGQTSAVLLLGSEKKMLFNTRRSCSFPKISASEENCGYDHIPDQTLQRMMETQSLNLNPPFCPSEKDDEDLCVVCFSEKACVHLECGHSCLCSQCANRVIRDFGTCPLCRQIIRT